MTVSGKMFYIQSKKKVQRLSEASMAGSRIIKEQLWLESSERERRRTKNRSKRQPQASGSCRSPFYFQCDGRVLVSSRQRSTESDLH